MHVGEAIRSGSIPILCNDLIPKTLDLVNPWIPPFGVAGNRAAVLFLLELSTHFFLRFEDVVRYVRVD